MSKKVSIKEMKNFANEADISDIPMTFSLGESKLNITFRPYLFLFEESDFVDDAVSYVFKDSEYHPEMTDIAFTAMVLKYMSNITMPTTKLDKNKLDINIIKNWDNNIHFIKKIYSLDTSNSIAENFVEYIKYLENVVDLKIKYLRNKSKSDILFETITNLVNEYKNKIKDTDVEKVIKDSSDVFNKVKSMDESKFVNAIIENTKENEKSKVNNKDNITSIDEVKTK